MLVHVRMTPEASSRHAVHCHKGRLAQAIVMLSALFVIGCANQPGAYQEASRVSDSASYRFSDQPRQKSIPTRLERSSIPDFTAAFETSVLVDQILAQHKFDKANRNGVKGLDKVALARKLGLTRPGQGGLPSALDQGTYSAAATVACTSGSKRVGAPKRTGTTSGSYRPACAPGMGQQVVSNSPYAPTNPWPAALRRGDHWDVVRGGLMLASLQHERLDNQVAALRQRPGSVDFLMNRAEPYLPYLLSEIKRLGLPSEMILIPMVESAFQTTAVSPKQAAGLWQFIPSTGQQYGLQFTETYDGRYDIHLATQAALRYLKHLNGLFGGDWLLAFASYNAGEGAVQRAIQANRAIGGKGTFWELDLPAETQDYVVKILALARVIANPQGNGFQPHRSGGQDTLARVEAAPDVSVQDVIASSGMIPDEFYRLNPAYKPNVEPPNELHNFLMPIDKAEALVSARLAGAKLYAPSGSSPPKKQALSMRSGARVPPI